MVSSASSSHDRTNTSSGSRNESLPKSSDPANFVAAFTIDAGRRDGTLESQGTQPSSDPVERQERPAPQLGIAPGVLRLAHVVAPDPAAPAGDLHDGAPEGSARLVLVERAARLPPW